jgi:hypothetical protein
MTWWDRGREELGGWIMDAIALLGWKVLLLVHQSESARMGE